MNGNGQKQLFLLPRKRPAATAGNPPPPKRIITEMSVAEFKAWYMGCTSESFREKWETGTPLGEGIAGEVKKLIFYVDDTEVSIAAKILLPEIICVDPDVQLKRGTFADAVNATSGLVALEHAGVFEQGDVMIGVNKDRVGMAKDASQFESVLGMTENTVRTGIGNQPADILFKPYVNVTALNKNLAAAGDGVMPVLTLNDGTILPPVYHAFEKMNVCVMGVYPSVTSVLEESPSDRVRLAIARAIHVLMATSIARKIAVPDFKLENIGWDGTSVRLLDLESLIFLDHCFDDTGIIRVAGTFIHLRHRRLHVTTYGNGTGGIMATTSSQLLWLTAALGFMYGMYPLIKGNHDWELEGYRDKKFGPSELYTELRLLIDLVLTRTDKTNDIVKDCIGSYYTNIITPLTVYFNGAADSVADSNLLSSFVDRAIFAE